jgi:predicted membrane channel-forming protein YqfA (hemolysin III family)
MALGHKAKRRLSILALVVGLPLYIAVAVTLVNWFDARFGRLPIWAEIFVYIGLGFLWALPLKPIFTGVGRPDPDAPQDQEQR